MRLYVALPLLSSLQPRTVAGLAAGHDGGAQAGKRVGLLPLRLNRQLLVLLPPPGRRRPLDLAAAGVAQMNWLLAPFPLRRLELGLQPLDPGLVLPVLPLAVLPVGSVEVALLVCEQLPRVVSNGRRLLQPEQHFEPTVPVLLHIQLLVQLADGLAELLARREGANELAGASLDPWCRADELPLAPVPSFLA